MQLAHPGLAVLVVGVTMVSNYETERDVRMPIGSHLELAGYRFVFQGVEEVPGPNYLAGRGTMEVTSPWGRSFTLYPEKRNYNASGMIMTQAAVNYGRSVTCTCPSVTRWAMAPGPCACITSRSSAGYGSVHADAGDGRCPGGRRQALPGGAAAPGPGTGGFRALPAGEVRHEALDPCCWSLPSWGLLYLRAVPEPEGSAVAAGGQARRPISRCRSSVVPARPSPRPNCAARSGC
jgi:hypothetical protein